MRKHYTPTFKAQMVQELLKEEQTVAQIASEHGVHPTQLNKWKATAIQGLPSLFTDDRKAAQAVQATHERQVQTLYAEIGRLTTQVAWLKKKSGLEPDAA
jgi:transposase-like protein